MVMQLGYPDTIDEATVSRGLCKQQSIAVYVDGELVECGELIDQFVDRNFEFSRLVIRYLPRRKR